MARTKKIPLSQQLFPASAKILPAGLRDGLDRFGDKAESFSKWVTVAALLAVFTAGVIRGLTSAVEYH